MRPSPAGTMASHPRNSLIRLAILLSLGLLATAAWAEGWVGVGAALREETRSIAFGNNGGVDYIFTGHKHFGVSRSADGGITWAQILDEFALLDDSTMEPAQVNVVLTSPTYGATPILLVGTSHGLVYRSTNHGDTWTIATGLPGYPVSEMSWHATTNHILACTYGGGIYKSTDGGSTFALLTNPPPAGTNDLIDLAFAGDYQTTGRVYAVSAASGTTSGALLLWNGSAWVDRSTGLLPDWGTRMYSFSSVEAGPAGDLWVGDMWGKGLLFSPNGGDTWSTACVEVDCQAVTEIRSAPDYFDTASRHVYIGTEWGWFEYILGACKQNMPAGLWVNTVIADPYWTTSYPLVWLATSDGIRMVGLGDFPKQGDNGGMNLFDISFIISSPSWNSDNFIYAASRQFGLFLSEDGGASFQQYMTSLAQATSGAMLSNEVSALALHPSFNAGGSGCGGNGKTVYMALEGGGVFFSDEAGSAWTYMGNGLPGGEKVTSLVHTPMIPYDFNYPLFAGINANSWGNPPTVFRYNAQALPPAWEATTPFPWGAGWEILTVALPPNHNGNTGAAEVFAGTDFGLFKSPNRGASWFDTNLPGFGPVTAVAFHPGYNGTTEQTLFAARAGAGVFKSADGGANWTSMNAGLTGCAGAPSYTWDFQNDGFPDDFTQSPMWTYPGAGLYTWKCTTTFNGQAVDRTGQVEVFPGAPPPCYLSFLSAWATPAVEVAPVIVDFFADYDIPGGCALTPAFSWNFGDGSTVKTEQYVHHLYRGPGVYNWTLTMTLGAKVYTATGKVTVLSVGACPWASRADASPAGGMSPLGVQFWADAVPLVYASALAVSPDYGFGPPPNEYLVVGVDHPTMGPTGGVYFSSDGANSWNMRNNGLADRHVRALAYANTPIGARLLCGTQKKQAFFTDSPHDDGAPWVHSADYGTTMGEIRAVALSPVPTDTGCAPDPNSAKGDVFVGGTEGVFWSNDGGETFRPINQWQVSGSIPCVPVVNALFAFISPANAAVPVPTPMLLAGTQGRGVWYRYAIKDLNSGAWDWTTGQWVESNNLKSETVNAFTRELNFTPLVIRAATTGGVYSTSETVLMGQDWAGSGSAVEFTDIANSQVPVVGLKIPNQPDAPSGNASWGTVSNSGVWKGVEGGYFSKGYAPSAVTWTEANGSGAGLLENMNTRSVVQLSDYTLLCGTNAAGVYRSEDEGVNWWEAVATTLGGLGKPVTDFLEATNGDVLCAVDSRSAGVYPDIGGVFLSGDKGRHWASISEGFDSSSQSLSTIVASTGTPPTYYAGTYTHGSYATTITAENYPTVTGLSASSGSATGGTSVTVTGTGFQSACPANYTCPDSAPVVVFGGVDAAATWVSATQLTVTTPAHPGGAVDVWVRNPDTRAVKYAGTFSFTEVEGGSPEFKVTITRDIANQVVVTWVNAPGGGATQVFRSPTVDFSRRVTTVTVSGTSGSYTFTDTTGTDDYKYYYKVE